MPSVSSVEKLPLHLVSGILAQLDTIAELSLAIRTHRTFYDAFSDNRQTIARNIIRSQNPPGVFPFAAALLESYRINPSNYDATRDLLSRLNSRLNANTACDVSLGHHEISEYALLSRDLSAVEILRDDMVAETLPLFKSRFELHHPSEVSDQELLRLNRAFLRYQLVCNLFCIPYKVGKPLPGEERTRRFFSPFSPWVNEQLLCVYAYLERKVAEAFDDVAAHDVEYGEMPIDWWEDGTECPHIQSHLCRGLSFLVDILHSKTFEERHPLLPMYPEPKRPQVPYDSLRLMMPKEAFVATLTHEEWWEPLSSCTATGIAGLSTPLDGELDSLSSKPCRIWLDTHRNDEIYEIMVEACRHRPLWECGYVIWDWGAEETTDLQSRCDAVSNMDPFFSGNQCDWTREDVIQSEMQRSYIWLSGGTGYWPRRRRSDEHYDFSRITGVDENDITSLIAKFRAEAEIGKDTS